MLSNWNGVNIVQLQIVKYFDYWMLLILNCIKNWNWLHIVDVYKSLFFYFVTTWKSIKVDSVILSSLSRILQSLTLIYRLDQWILFFVPFVWWRNCHVFDIVYDIRCRIRCNVVIKQPVTKKNKWIDRVCQSDWLQNSRSNGQNDYSNRTGLYEVCITLNVESSSCVYKQSTLTLRLNI